MNHKRISRARFCELLRSLIDEPGTIPELIKRWGHSKNFVYSFVRTLHLTHVLRISKWELAPRTPPTPVYAFGDAEDEPPPKFRPNGRPVLPPRQQPAPRKLPSELIGFLSVLRALEIPLFPAEVAEVTGVATQRMRRLLEHMRLNGLVYVESWAHRPNGGPLVPRYQFGIDKRDATKRHFSRAEVNARYWRRRRLKRDACPLVVTLAANGYEFQQRA